MTTYSYHADQLALAYGGADVFEDYARARLTEAYNLWLGMNDHAAIDKVITACINLCTCIDYIVDEYTGSVPYYRLMKIHRSAWEYTMYSPPSYTLTSKKICEAWAKNDFKDRMLTIAFIDRMRQLLWDEPFRVVWAGKPEEEY